MRKANFSHRLRWFTDRAPQPAFELNSQLTKYRLTEICAPYLANAIFKYRENNMVAGVSTPFPLIERYERELNIYCLGELSMKAHPTFF